jgi:hypothetical protein
VSLNPAQKTTFKNDRAANTNTILAYTLASPNERVSTQIKDVVEIADNYQFVADWYNLLAAPDYFVHRSDVTRGEVYKTTVSSGDSSSGTATSWDWTGYKNQGVPEQDAWKEMMMGGCDFGSLNNRAGALAIFGTAGAGGANRTHIFNVAKRRVTNLERLYVVDVPSPPNNTGNADGDDRGSKTNPDVLGFEGSINGPQVADAILNG